MRTTEPPDVASYSYAGAGYANPHAATQIGNGTATTTYAYDNNGNLTSAGTGSATTSYSYDYANRLIAILYNNATTSTYGYDAFGARVYQITASTSAATTTYPFKFYSVASTTKSSTNFATSTGYVFNGDTLLATMDQAFKNGSATGTAITSYIHPDHLGSTNVVTNGSGTVVQVLDYYPYGSQRINSGQNVSQRKFIGQFSDGSGLDYLQARYEDPARGQFLSEDPVFLGDPKGQVLSDPQSLNSYSYGNDNPITKSDPTGRQFCEDACIGEIIAARVAQWAIPVIRAGLTTGLVSTDAQIGSNLYQQARGNGQNTMSVGSLGNAFGQGFAFGATAETGAGFGSPLAAPFFRTARSAKLFGQTVSAGAVTVAVDTANGNSSPWQTAGDAAFSMMSTYGATRMIGVPRGSDVKSFSSPVFFSGSQMSKASRNAVVSQSIQSALTSLVGALQGLLVSLQSQQSSSKSK